MEELKKQLEEERRQTAAQRAELETDWQQRRRQPGKRRRQPRLRRRQQKILRGCPEAGGSVRKEAENAKQEAKELLVRERFQAKKVNLKSVKSTKKKQVKITWKRLAGAHGYELQYADNSKFQKAKRLKIRKEATVTRMIKRLKSRRTCYVRVRAYKTIDKEKVYTKYSNKKYAKIK